MPTSVQREQLARILENIEETRILTSELMSDFDSIEDDALGSYYDLREIEQQLADTANECDDLRDKWKVPIPGEKSEAQNSAAK